MKKIYHAIKSDALMMLLMMCTSDAHVCICYIKYTHALVTIDSLK